MTRAKLIIPAVALAFTAAIAIIAIAEPSANSSAKPDLKLPPGYTEADMQACMMARGKASPPCGWRPALIP
jgi:hypothetical protein